MLQPTPTREATTSWVAAIYEDKQRRRLVLAVILLLTAITAVLVRNYVSANNNGEAATADSGQPAYAPSAAGPPPVIPVAGTKAPAATGYSEDSSRSASSHAHRAGRRIAVNSVKHETSGASASVKPSANWGMATTAADRAHTSEQAQAHQPAPAYPLLTQASAVQGSVLLQALISADGTVQEMRVISGPAILVSAAREAVERWRFKPFLVNGKPVETYARVTVNFTIDVSNTEARYHIDTVTSSGAL